MPRLTIAPSCIPSQNGTSKSVVEPREFSPTDWMFNTNRAYSYDWRNGNAITNNDNYFAKAEPYQKIKTGMFNPLTGQEPIYGHVNYRLNPMDQEQTMSHMSGYENQLQTRVSDNMNPGLVMRYPPQLYRVGVWQNCYQSSTK